LLFVSDLAHDFAVHAASPVQQRLIAFLHSHVSVMRVMRVNAAFAAWLSTRLDAMLPSLVCVSFCRCFVLFIPGSKKLGSRGPGKILVRRVAYAYYAHIWRVSSYKFDADVFSI
jgi:hypothetical protein